MRFHRKEMVASVIRQVVSEALVHRLHDPRIEVLTTVPRVEVSGDLLTARIYLSIPGGEGVERRTLRGVQHARKYLQRLVAEALDIRQCPELRILIDEREKGARRTLEILARNREAEPHVYDDLADAGPDGREYDVEDPDEHGPSDSFDRHSSE